MSEEEKIAHELQLLYAETLKEPIPAYMQELVERLNLVEGLTGANK